MNNTTYSTGSVSVAASGTTVTGSGTAWLSSGIREGDLIMIAGLTAQIAAVGTNTSLTLKRAWPGAAQSGANYDIIMLDDEVRGLIAANALLQALSGGTLTSLGQIAGAANQMPYWTGTGVMEATGLTSEARSLLGSSLLSRSGNNLVTDAAARIVGGVVTQGSLDTTAGRVLTPGWMGLGATNQQPQGANLDNALLNQFFGIDSLTQSSSPALPFGTQSHGASGIALSFGAEYGGQLAFSRFTDEMAFRRRGAGGIWHNWRRIYNGANIVGTVSWAGGAPTGSVIERGSNANGEYVKFADGTMICTKRLQGLGPASTALGSGFVSANISIGSWPAAFSERPSVSVTPYGVDSHVMSGGLVTPPTATVGGTTLLSRWVSSAATTFEIIVTGIGRWF